MTIRSLLAIPILLYLFNCNNNPGQEHQEAPPPQEIAQKATKVEERVEEPVIEKQEEEVRIDSLFESFKALFPPLVLPYKTDSFGIVQPNSTPIDTTSTEDYSIGEPYGKYLIRDFVTLEGFGTVPRYEAIGQFQVNESITALVYYYDGWMGQAGSDDQIYLSVYDRSGRVMGNLKLYDVGGYNYDWADGDGIGESSTVLNAIIKNPRLITVTKVEDHYIGYQDSISWAPLIRSDTTIKYYNINPKGKLSWSYTL